MQRIVMVMGCLLLFASGHAHASKPTVKTQSAPIIGKTKASRLLSSIPRHSKSDSDESVTQNKLQGQFNVANNYLFRGISQTNNLPAAQGGASYSFAKTGVYVGLWGSNVHFVDVRNNTAFIELNPSIGIAKTINNHVNYDISLTRYSYPNMVHTDYNELNAYLNYHLLMAHVAYSNDVYATGKSGEYYNLGINYLIPSKYIHQIKKVHITAGIGYSQLPQNAGLRSYQDYQISINKTFHEFACAIQWTDTNGRSVDPRSLKGNLFTVTVGRSF